MLDVMKMRRKDLEAKYIKLRTRYEIVCAKWKGLKQAIKEKDKAVHRHKVHGNKNMIDYHLLRDRVVLIYGKQAFVNLMAHTGHVFDAKNYKLKHSIGGDDEHTR